MIRNIFTLENGGALFISGADDAKEYKALEQLGISVIVNVAYGIKLYPPATFTHMEFKLLDDGRFPDPIIEEQQKVLFKNAVDSVLHMLRKGRKVLVHCAAGISRSGIVCIAVTHCVTAKSWEESEKIVVTQNPASLLLNRPLLAFHRGIYKCPKLST